MWLCEVSGTEQEEREGVVSAVSQRSSRNRSRVCGKRRALRSSKDPVPFAP